MGVQTVAAKAIKRYENNKLMAPNPLMCVCVCVDGHHVENLHTLTSIKIVSNSLLAATMFGSRCKNKRPIVNFASITAF